MPAQTSLAPVPEARESRPSNPGETVTAQMMSPIAIEAALADLAAWRRDTDRTIARLEAELAQAKARAADPSRPDLQREPTAAIFPEFEVLRNMPEVTGAPAHAAPVVHAAPAASASAPQVAHLVSARGEVSARVVAAPARVHFDLEMKPGEFLDVPTELNGGRRKTLLVTLVALIILGGLTALVIMAVASQR